MHGEHSRRSFSISSIVSVVAEMAVGDSVQTIEILVVLATSFCLLGLFGKVNYILIAPPSERSVLERITGTWRWSAF